MSQKKVALIKQKTQNMVENPQKSLEERRRQSQRISKRAASNYLQLHIRLEDIEPPIWRRIIIAEDRTFEDLHRVLQRIMSWHNAHMHLFHVTNPNTGADEDLAPDSFVADPEFPVINEVSRRLSNYLNNVGHTCIYEYDTGDNWEHLIEVEQIFDHNPNPGGAMVRCIGGARAAPPEDSGSVPGYEHLLEVLTDLNHEEHDEMREWLESQGYPNWDPEHFNLNEANAGLL